MNTSRQWRGLEGTGLRSGAWATKSSKDPVRQRAIRGQRGGRAALMRINIWIVLAVLLALLATTRLLRDQHETQRICADDPSDDLAHRPLARPARRAGLRQVRRDDAPLCVGWAI